MILVVTGEAATLPFTLSLFMSTFSYMCVVVGTLTVFLPSEHVLNYLESQHASAEGFP